MKNYVCLFGAVFLWCVLLPALVKPAIAGQAVENTNESEVVSTGDSGVSVCYFDSFINQKINMGLENYVARALSFLMPENIPYETLKAQAVAIRSVVCYRYENNEHESFYLCSDPEHCFSLAAYPREDCVKAAEETAGVILTWEGKAALALSHLSSLIKTENYETVYGKKIPYLVSLPVYDEKDMPGYKTTVKLTVEDFKGAFSDYSVVFNDDKEKWIGKTEFTQGGRVYITEIGGLRFKGSTVARLLGLKSLCFSIDINEDEVVIQTYGNGSGIGMSRNTAVLMAKEGEDYKKILEYFYPGTSFSVIKAYKQN